MAVSIGSSASKALERGNGLLRLAPTWVPRGFCVPGRRIKLHPDDYYTLGGNRGGITERWFSSAVRADNGPLAPPDEGLSIVVGEGGERLPFDRVVDALGAELIGERLWSAYGTWPVYSKFFDNKYALPFHLHLRDEHAGMVKRPGKPEAYYFPLELNNHPGDFPYTCFGLKPGITRDQVKERLADFHLGDNRVTTLSKAYRLTPGTGWDVPAGILHAPGSLCTYEPQAASDVFAIFEGVSAGQIISEDLLWKDMPVSKRGDLNAVVDLIDWDANHDPEFEIKRFMMPVHQRGSEDEGYIERWIVYRSSAFSAKELTILPGAHVRIHDSAAYGFILTQGHGMVDDLPLEAPTLIRFGQLTHDEYFVAESAAERGIVFANQSLSEPLILLKHFGPANPDHVASGLASAA